MREERYNMPQIDIRKDSKLVQLITAQARGERVDTDQADKAAR